jgi:glycerol-3-phosphate dehydrogenase
MDRPDASTEWAQVYGSDLLQLNAMAESQPEWNAPLHPLLPFRQAEVIWAARNEMARHLEDVLARRTRALFLNAPASLEAAPKAAALLAQELGYDSNWEQQELKSYEKLAARYTWQQ